MHLSRLAWLAALALVACTDRPLDSASDTATGSTTAEPPGTSTNPPPSATDGPPTPGTAGPPTTSDGPPTTSPPSDTTTTSATSASDTTSGETTSDDTGKKFDMPPSPPLAPNGLVGCTEVAPAGTNVAGKTALGPFKSTRAFFGEVNVNGWIGEPILVLVEDAADLESVFVDYQDGWPDTGPLATLQGNLAFTEADKWTGETKVGAVVIAGGQTTQVAVVLKIDAHPGTWDLADPADPPRIVGTLAPDEADATLAGDFDAVYCDLMRLQIIAE